MIEEDQIKQDENSLDWIKADEAKTAASDAADEPVSGDLLLEGSLTIAEAEAMHQQLARILQANVDITIDAEALSRVDTAGTQLIYAFIKEAKSRSIAFRWKAKSDALAECAATLGLAEGMEL